MFELCERMKRHLALAKCVVYSCSWQQREKLAKEFQCKYYHGGTADNEERLEAMAGADHVTVATSALGISVDFPVFVYTLHVDNHPA